MKKKFGIFLVFLFLILVQNFLFVSCEFKKPEVKDNNKILNSVEDVKKISNLLFNYIYINAITKSKKIRSGVTTNDFQNSHFYQDVLNMQNPEFDSFLFQDQQFQDENNNVYYFNGQIYLAEKTDIQYDQNNNPISYTGNYVVYGKFKITFNGITEEISFDEKISYNISIIYDDNGNPIKYSYNLTFNAYVNDYQLENYTFNYEFLIPW